MGKTAVGTELVTIYWSHVDSSAEADHSSYQRQKGCRLRGTVPVLRSTCSWRLTTYVGKPSAVGQPTRPTQPFIPSGSIDE